SWEPFDLGLRRASVAAATASRAHRQATVTRTQFDGSVATADAYLTLLAAQETVRAAQAGGGRAQVLAQSVRGETNAHMRAGAEASRADTELATARTQLAQAQQAQEIAHAVLSQFIGIPPQQIALSAAKLLQLPPEEPIAPLNVAENPIASE